MKTVSDLLISSDQLRACLIRWTAPARPRLLALRWLAWALLAAVGLYFFAGAALPFLISFDENSYGRFWPYAPWLLAHVVGGTFALVLGPLQFWSSVRTRYRELHRWSGRLYLAAVALAAVSAFYLSFNTPLFAFAVGLFTLATVWSVCTALAYVAIRNGRVRAHREWMIRSYVVTFTFVNFRLLLMLALMLELGDARDVVPTAGWLSLVVPLFATEVVLRWRETTTPARTLRLPGAAGQASAQSVPAELAKEIHLSCGEESPH